MKRAKTNITVAAVSLFALAALFSLFACSSNSQPAVASVQAASAAVRPAALKTVVPEAQPAPVAAETPTAKAEKKLMTFRSRNYGVSFVYPWQYAYISAKAVNGDESLQPKSDGFDGQFTLVRIEVPKGFFPDTDLESGYFMLSLNQNLGEPECVSGLGKDAQTSTINGVDFKWAESESGGGGEASRIRNYVAFTNGVCYEVELGVKTRNSNGLVREVDPEQVMRRLDAILGTVKIQQAAQPAVAKVEASEAQVPQN